MVISVQRQVKKESSSAISKTMLRICTAVISDLIPSVGFQRYANFVSAAIAWTRTSSSVSVDSIVKLSVASALPS
ncbi:hypothetical protein NIES23_43990 [Trichormus variabilis NIES-23]|uniref:Uncharacterized protein n=1 Tax=Trichormus variabilis NIES-23 TaxID=1973479 RepID=A0A1Z4KRF9_ANAVA|nr:hypothetical protein NIES23_43990 [Trichormus variabilis NIES-23]